ncbi:uncharacterized protein LOC100568708 isoform X2 [Acyrthosiphon pisum]|uniref:Uncharacterized protein n=1 Tax=Acyrthosiphon pisum TaxID=7029 RepID=A0A8R2B9Q7_ACYPI|nr:uncharacterized protein LOC100568708 isoform X2 [Acyrthosiphon pisum]|eukprot:XP_008187860.1 PREDICTED: uncharacterized protein LOC100568708 isoform X2 [Acyrthosiphon pisum]
MAKTMADWHTPTQVERSLAAMWMKLEKSNVPLKDISEKDLISYFGNKKPVVQKLQNELLFNSNKSFDPKSKQDSWRNKKEIHDNIYEEVGIPTNNACSVIPFYWSSTQKPGRTVVSQLYM